MHRKSGIVISLILCLSLCMPVFAIGENELPKRDPFYLEQTKFDYGFLNDLPNEYINLNKGDLMITQTDILIPGDADLNLKIQRYYTSHVWVISGADRTPYGISEMSPLGFGWQMHMGKVENIYGDGVGDNLPVVVMPDGSRHPLYKDSNNANQLISKELWTFKAIDNYSWKLTLTNGTKYIFKYSEDPTNPAGHNMIMSSMAGWIPDPNKFVAQATEIQDTHNNKISIKYKKISDSQLFLKIPKIDYITDSCGRIITFNYYSDIEAAQLGISQGLLKSIIFNGAAYVYSYNRDSHNQYFNLLTKVELPEGNPWQYEYHTDPAFDHSYLRNDLLLKKLTYPTGATVEYTYKEQYLTATKNKNENNFPAYSYYYLNSKIVRQKTVAGRDISTSLYTYSIGNTAPENGADFDVSSVTYPSGKIEKYYFYGWGATEPTREVIGATEYQNCSTLWKLGSLVKTEVYDSVTNKQLTNETEYQKSNQLSTYYEYQTNVQQKEGIFFPLSSKKKITQGKDFTTDYTTYDNYGNPTRIVENGDGETRTTNLTYKNDTVNNILGKVTSNKIAIGTEEFTSSYDYNNSGDMTSATEQGVTRTFTYHGNGNLKTETDGKGHFTVYDDYTYGRPETIKYGAADTDGTNAVYSVTQVINSTGTIASVTNGRGYTMSYTYDKLNRLTKSTPPIVAPPTPLEKPTIITYANDGSYKKVEKGITWTQYYFDGLGHNTGTENVAGIKTKITYDSSGNITFKSYPYETTETIGERYEYDTLNRIKKVTKPYYIGHPDNATITYSYDDINHMLSITNENSVKDEYSYQSFGDPQEKRLIKTRQAVDTVYEATTTYTYNALGSVTKILLPQGVTKTYTYNANNQLTTENTPEKGITTYTYYANGTVATKTDAKNNITTYYYDSLNRPTVVDYSSGNEYDMAYTHDNADNKTWEMNSHSGTEYTYNALNKLTSKTENIKGKLYTTTYTYNDQGLVATMTYPTGRQLTYTYDNGNRLIALSPYANNITYHPSGKIKSYTTANGKTITMTYDDLARLDTIAGMSGSLDYNYDKRSNITYLGLNLEAGAKNLQFGYDSLDRIVSNTTTGPQLPPTVLMYGYDQLGNRTQKISNSSSTPYYYDSGNRLYNDFKYPYCRYIYDAIGNYNWAYTTLYNIQYAIEKYTIGANDKITIGTPGRKEYSYAPNQNKIAEKNEAGTTVYHYNEAGNVIAETGEDGTLKREYVYLGAMLLAKEEKDGIDLAVYKEDIGFSPSRIYPVNKPITINAKVRNYGSSVHTGDIKVNFYEVTPSTTTVKPLTLIGTKTITGSGTAQLTWTPTTRGVHEIYAYVDPPTSVITEIDKTNNIASNFLFTDPTYIRQNPKDQEAFKAFLRKYQGKEVNHE